MSCQVALPVTTDVAINFEGMCKLSKDDSLL